MARILIKQKDDKYSIWSTIVDAIIEKDLTKEEVYDFFKEDAITKSIENTNYLFTRIGTYKNGVLPNTIEEAEQYNN